MRRFVVGLLLVATGIGSIALALTRISRPALAPARLMGDVPAATPRKLTRVGNLLIEPDRVIMAHLELADDGHARDSVYVSTDEITLTVTDQTARDLWALLAARTGEPTPSLPPPPGVVPPGSAWCESVGDGVLIRRTGGNTALALVLYCEGGTHLTAEWTRDQPVNVFILGADPKKKWTLMVDASQKTIIPDAKGYAYEWLDRGTHRLALTGD